MRETLYFVNVSVSQDPIITDYSVSTTINSDYHSKKFIHSALVTHKQMRRHYRYGLQQAGSGQRSVGRVLISILSANSVPATPQLGPHPPSLLELWYFNKYWKSDCCSASQLCFQHLLFFQVLIDSKRSLFRSILTLLGWIFPPSEAKRWKQDVKNIIFCTCQC